MAPLNGYFFQGNRQEGRFQSWMQSTWRWLSPASLSLMSRDSVSLRSNQHSEVCHSDVAYSTWTQGWSGTHAEMLFCTKTMASELVVQTIGWENSHWNPEQGKAEDNDWLCMQWEAGMGELWQEARDTKHGTAGTTWCLNLMQGWRKSPVWMKSPCLFLEKVLRTVPEWLVTETISVALNTQIGSREWDYLHTSAQEGLQSFWY